MHQAARTTNPPHRMPNEHATAPRRSPRPLAAAHWLTTAALLVITFGLSFAAFGSLGLRSTPPPALPAAVVQAGTPEATSDTQFAVTFPTPVLPAGPIYAWSTLYAVEPGVSAAYPGFDIDDPVAAVVWVQSGTLAIDGEHVAVHRASAGAPVASLAAGDLLLGAGDAVGLALGPGRSYHLRSVGPEQLVFAEFWLVGGLRPEYTYPEEYQILDYHNIPDATILPAPATVTMRLTQVVLPAKGTLEPPENSWQLTLPEWRSLGNITRFYPSGGARNVARAPISDVTVVAMTAEFPGAATPPARPPPASQPNPRVTDKWRQRYPESAARGRSPGGCASPGRPRSPAALAAGHAERRGSRSSRSLT